ncbi:MAG TPA: Lrp/AsnC family transcriptional regulator [Candidatus Thermoplasmatota archaeon]|nr:Lrp/AsnC family transcriptional regulator [Candidatus Thermoplasmatota archaeon]
MDALDIRILRALGTRPFAEGPRPPESTSATALARKLHVSRNTVHERIQALKTAGVLARFQAYPNLRHLGIDWTAFHLVFPDDASRERAASHARTMRSASRVLEFMGPHLCVDLYYASPEERDVRLREACQAAGTQIAHTLENHTMPAIRRPLSSLDWRIIRELRGDARRPLTEVAARVGASYRTVKRRVDAMRRDGDLDVSVEVDPSRIPGAIPLGMVYKLRNGMAVKATNALRRALDERYFLAYAPADETLGDLAMEAFATSAAELETLRQRVMAVPGVEGLTILVSQRVSYSEAWLDAAIAKRVAETEAKRPATVAG